MTPHDAVAHLTPATWAAANRALVRKLLAELAHERVLVPEPLGDGRWRVRSDDGATTYDFAAQVLALEHWHVEPATLTRTRDGEDLPLDAVDAVLDLRGALGLSDTVLPVYVEEVTSTLAGAAYKLVHRDRPAQDLARASFQEVEAGMTEGHPCFVAANGRLGLGVEDHHRYAPEAGAAVHLLWVAAHRDHAQFSAGRGVEEHAFLREQLGDEVVTRFTAVLTGAGLDPADYTWIPVHPWQWRQRIAVTFAAEVAQQRLVLLGESEHEYQAQQSIRTFLDRTDPTCDYVKTALSVLNMGFLRGLSAAYMAATPAINDWVADLVAGDPVLRATGVEVLRERAAVGYRHERLERATDRTSPYRKMLAALWRESPVPRLTGRQRLLTMAALLHVDARGGSLAAALVRESGLAPTAWLRRYLDAYLVPLVHCLCAHDLAFMPHGENVVLVVEDGVVDHVVLKDIGEEVVVLDADATLPPDVARIRADVPRELHALSIVTDVLDCFLRHLSAILHTTGTLDQDDFWRTVAESLHGYADAVPEQAERLAELDLFADEVPLSCLNRLQLRDNQQMVDLADPSSALQVVGTMPNPLARWARVGHGAVAAT